MANIPPVPGTTPQDWISFVNLAINTQLPINVDLQALDITNTQQLIEFMQANNWEPVYRMSETIVGWAQVSGANPAETTAVAVRPATDLILAGGAGTAASELVAGRGAFGMVKKSIIAATCMAIFVSSLTPLGTQEQADYKQAILDAITPFTIDGENVPVFIDEDGKTYLSEAILNGVREELVNLGTYTTTGEPETDIDINTVISPFISSKSMLDAWCDGCIQYGTTAQDAWFSKNHTLYNQTANDFWAQALTDAMTWVKNNAPALPSDCFYVVEQTTTTSGSPYWMGFRVMVCRNDPAQSVSAIAPLAGRSNYLVQYDDSPVDFIAVKTGYTTNPSFTVVNNTAVPNYSFAIYDRNSSTYRSAPSSNTVSIGATLTFNKNLDSIEPCYIRDTGSRVTLRMYVINSTAGTAGIPGVDVTGKSDFGDLSKTLDDAIQGLADRAVELLNPTDEDMTNKDTWYPANLRDEDVFTDGLDDAQTDPEVNTQGDPDTDSKDEIIDKLLQIIQDITGTPDLPDIPAGDSGNTPPAEPPVLNGSSNGLWTMYNPTKQQVNDFGAWLWSDTLIDQIIRQFNSPIDAVIGFHQIYCTPITGSQKIIKAGYLDSPVSAAEVTNQYVDIDCGQVSVNEYYGNALDYDNTQVSLFLPFVGIVPLNTNVVMGSVLHVIYRIDVFTGTCLAQVKVIKENSNAVMYAFEGNCAVQIPLTGTTYTGMVGALLGGLSASVSFMAGDMYHGAMGALSAITSAGTGLTGVKQSGNMGANAGSLGIRIPYLIITRSASAMPAGFEGLRGIPSTELVTLGSVSGFTSVRDVHLEGIPATAEEINEIRELLSEGVIL